MNGAWKYFEKSKLFKTEAKSFLCLQTIRTSNKTSNTISHLERKHSKKELEKFNSKILL